MKSKRIYAFICAFLCLCLSAAAQNPRSAPHPPGIEVDRPDRDRPSAAVTEKAAVPLQLTLPAGTLLAVTTTQPLSSDQNKPGDSFITILEQPVVAQGWVTARRGQTVIGRVVEAQKAGQSNASSRLAIELSELSLVDGGLLPIRTQLAEVSSGSPLRSRNEGIAVGATAGAGAVIGAIAGGGPGAAIGAAIGAAAGVAGVLSTRGRPTEIAPETQLIFRLENPVTISTEQSRQAFSPVTSDDYSREPARHPYPAVQSYPPPPPPYYPAPYYYGWYAPYGYFGFYGYFGPGYYRGIRAYAAPGYHGHYR